MFKRVLILLTLLLLGTAFPVLGQTVVNLSVTDTPDNQAWNNGTWSVKLQPPAGNLSQTNTFTLLSGGGSLAAQNGTLSGTGTASMSLPANANTGPSGTVWQFTVCPQASAGCFQQSVTISTSSPQTLAINPPSIRINLATATPPISAYATGEISGAVIGSQFYLLGTGIQVCSTISGSTCTTWTAAGGGISSNSPVPANQAQGPQYNVVNYASGLTINDAKKTNTATDSLGSSVITDVTNHPWVAGDVGKKIFCIDGQSGTNTGGSSLTPSVTTITVFTSSSSITVAGTGSGSPGAGQSCIWFSNKATTAFKAANTAAIPTPPTSQALTQLGSAGSVYCPTGGYVIDNNFFDSEPTTANSYAPNFIGEGIGKCRIYPSPDAPLPAGGFWIYNKQGYGQTFSGFTIDCSSFNFAFNAGTAFITQLSVQQFVMKDIEFDYCGMTNGGNQVIDINGSTTAIIENLRLNSAPSGQAAQSLKIENGSNGLTFRNFFETNPGPNPLLINASGGKTSGGSEIIFEGGVLDEGGNPGAIQLVGSNANFIGVTAFAGTTDVLDVDATSTAFVSDSNFEPFGGSCGGGNRNAIKIASGGTVYSNLNVLAGCGGATGPAVSGPAGATYVDIGGNILRNCPAGCPTVTAATYSSAYGGGIVPKATVTHTPNTCYAVTGNLLATAQNICTFINDQNYQVLNITAQSGGTTPANSSCATPPVITLSDGTRTATLTMTTGKTQWSSAVDAATVGSVFATGTTLTISIGANTCATPPVNVAVSYVLQSVLNP